jgi:hypothetical protein
MGSMVQYGAKSIHTGPLKVSVQPCVQIAASECWFPQVVRILLAPYYSSQSQLSVVLNEALPQRVQPGIEGLLYNIFNALA